MNREGRIAVVAQVLDIVEVTHERLAEWIVDALAQRQGDDSYEFHVRRSAPGTSKAITDKMREGTFQDDMLRLFMVAGSRGWTDDELEQAMTRAHQSASATRNVLMHKGYVEDSGLTRKNRYDNDCQVYAWTGKAVKR